MAKKQAFDNMDFNQVLLEMYPAKDSALPKAGPMPLPGIEKFDPPPADRFTKEECLAVLSEYSKTYNLTPPQTIHSITNWAQNGGYVKSVPNRKLPINGGPMEELYTLRSICGKIRPGGTVRQLCRALAFPIYRAALHLTYVGHLHKSLQLYRPDINTSDAIQACEFYSGLKFTFPIIEDALAQRAKDRKAKSSGNKKGKKEQKEKKDSLSFKLGQLYKIRVIGCVMHPL